MAIVSTKHDGLRQQRKKTFVVKDCMTVHGGPPVSLVVRLVVSRDSESDSQLITRPIPIVVLNLIHPTTKF